MKNTLAILIFAVLLILVVLYLAKQNNPTQPEIANISAIGQRTKEDGCQVNGPYQDKACTPGAIFPDVTVEQICVRGYSKSVRNVPVSKKREVFREYGIAHHSP